MRGFHRLTALFASLSLALAGCSFIPAYTSPPGFQAAAFAPANTWLFSTVTLRPSLGQLMQASRLADVFTSQPGWDASIRSLERSGTGSQVDFTRDVLPLLDGEIATAVYGSGPDLSTGGTPSILVLAHSSDPAKLVRTLASGSAASFQAQTDARGATFYAAHGQTNVATFKGWLLLGDSRTTLDDAIGRIAGGGNGLDAQPRFRQVVDRLPAERVAFQYADLGPILRSSLALAGSTARGELPVPASELESELSQIDVRVAASVALRQEGADIRVEATTSGLPPQQEAELAASSGSALDAFNRLPAGTLVALGAPVGQLPPEIDQVVNEAVAGALADVAGPDVQAPELHLSQWLSGQWAFGAAQGTVGQPNGQPDLFLLAGVSDATAAQRDLNGLAVLFPPKSVVPVDVAGHRLLQGTAGLGETVTYGVADDWLYVVSGDAESVVGAADTGGLSANPRFAEMTNGLGDDPVNVFVDIQGVRTLGESLADRSTLREYQSSVQPFVTPLRYFGGGSRTDPNGDAHGHFILGIG